MLPNELTAEHFSAYPSQARALAIENLAVLRDLPLSFLAGLLRQVIDYDYRFPAERRALERELTNLARLSATERAQWLQGFAGITLSLDLHRFDWVNSPSQFVEQLSAHLWATHQLDAFRVAATEYSDRLHRTVPVEAPVVPRLGITIVGAGVDSYEAPLFRRLRPHGAYFTQVIPNNGLQVLMDVVGSRAKAHPQAYAHWYIDGGEVSSWHPGVTCISYAGLAAARSALLGKMRSEIKKPGAGPEMLRTLMARMVPADLGFATPGDPVLDRFQVKLLTEGSGTQIFSTSFTQWAAREALRRAEPSTLLVRFAPRQRQKPMNELLSPSVERPELDPVGSLVDADMGAYYNWINQQRLSGADGASFVAWFEGHSIAFVIGPSVPRGTQSDTPTDLSQLLSWIL